jgi:hypothetical protein
MADEPRDPQVAAWLEVEPLDDVTRRRLVSTALRESAPPAKSPPRAWRWIAAAAAVVLVGGITVAVVTASGGQDEQQASTPVNTPKASDSLTQQADRQATVATLPYVGDFGDLDQPANLRKLRSALTSSTSFSTSEQAPAAAAAPASDASGAAASTCPLGIPPLSDTPIAEASGTMDGRRATVILFESAKGSHSYGVLLEDPCEFRHLP